MRGDGDGFRDLLRGQLSLHGCRIQHDPHVRHTALECRQHVAQRGRLRTRDDAHRAREQRQRTLARLVEQAFGAELFLQAHERFVQRADAGAADGFDVDLVVAARAVQGDERAHLDLVAFARREPRVLGAAAEHDGTHLGRVILQREIPVAAGGTREIRDLAADPYEREGAFQQARDLLVEGRDGQYGRGGIGRVGVVGGKHMDELVDLSTKTWCRTAGGASAVKQQVAFVND